MTQSKLCDQLDAAEIELHEVQGRLSAYDKRLQLGQSTSPETRRGLILDIEYAELKVSGLRERVKHEAEAIAAAAKIDVAHRAQALLESDRTQVERKVRDLLGEAQAILIDSYESSNLDLAAVVNAGRQAGIRPAVRDFGEWVPSSADPVHLLNNGVMVDGRIVLPVFKPEDAARTRILELLSGSPSLKAMTLPSSHKPEAVSEQDAEVAGVLFARAVSYAGIDADIEPYTPDSWTLAEPSTATLRVRVDKATLSADGTVTAEYFVTSHGENCFGVPSTINVLDVDNARQQLGAMGYTARTAVGDRVLITQYEAHRATAPGTQVVTITGVVPEAISAQAEVPAREVNAALKQALLSDCAQLGQRNRDHLRGGAELYLTLEATDDGELSVMVSTILAPVVNFRGVIVMHGSELPLRGDVLNAALRPHVGRLVIPGVGILSSVQLNDDGDVLIQAQNATQLVV